MTAERDSLFQFLPSQREHAQAVRVEVAKALRGEDADLPLVAQFLDELIALSTPASPPSMTPLDRATAGLDRTMACAEGSPWQAQHDGCRGVVCWEGEPVGPCACECHKEKA
jgi:hypothetical protein